MTQDLFDTYLEERDLLLGNEPLKTVVKDGQRTLEVDPDPTPEFDAFADLLMPIKLIKDADDKLMEFGNKFLGGVPETFRSGLIKGGITNPLKLFVGEDSDIAKTIDKLTDVEAKTALQTFSKETAKFFGSYLGLGKILRAGKVGEILKKGGRYMPEFLSSFGSVITAYEGKDENLADMVVSLGVPEDAPLVRDLIYDENRSEFANRFNNAIADLPFEGIGITLGHYLSKYFAKRKGEKVNTNDLKKMENVIQKQASNLLDKQTMGSMLNPDGELAKGINFISTQDAVINYVQSPRLFSREKLVKVLDNDFIAKDMSVEKLKNEPGVDFRNNTIRTFRVVTVNDNTPYKREKFASVSIKPAGIEELARGDTILLQYDIPLDTNHILGHLKTIGKYTKGTQKRLQEYNQPEIDRLRARLGGTETDARLKNTKKISERLLRKEGEIIARVDDLKPVIVKPFKLRNTRELKLNNNKSPDPIEDKLMHENDKTIEEYFKMTRPDPKDPFKNSNQNALRDEDVIDIINGKINKPEDMRANVTIAPRDHASNRIILEDGTLLEGLEETQIYENAMKQQYIDYYKNLFRPQEFRNVDANNFYLRSEAALNKMTAKKAKKGHFYKQFKRLNVKDDELLWLGLDNMKENQELVTKDYLRSRIRANMMDFSYLASTKNKSSVYDPEEIIDGPPVATYRISDFSDLKTEGARNHSNPDFKATYDEVRGDLDGTADHDFVENYAREQADEAITGLGINDSSYRGANNIAAVEALEGEMYDEALLVIRNNEQVFPEFEKTLREEIIAYLKPRFDNLINQGLTGREFSSQKLDTLPAKIAFKNEFKNEPFMMEYINEHLANMGPIKLPKSIESLQKGMAGENNYAATDELFIQDLAMYIQSNYADMRNRYAEKFAGNVIRNKIAIQEYFPKTKAIIDDNTPDIEMYTYEEEFYGEDVEIMIVGARDKWVAFRNNDQVGIDSIGNENGIWPSKEEALIQLNRNEQNYIQEVDIDGETFTEFTNYQRESVRDDAKANYKEHTLNLDRFRGLDTYMDLMGAPVFDIEGQHFNHRGLGAEDQVVHFRTEDRFDEQGKKYLYPFEIQSDWGQKYRDYYVPGKPTELIPMFDSPRTKELVPIVKENRKILNKLVKLTKSLIPNELQQNVMLYDIRQTGRLSAEAKTRQQAAIETVERYMPMELYKDLKNLNALVGQVRHDVYTRNTKESSDGVFFNKFKKNQAEIRQLVKKIVTRDINMPGVGGVKLIDNPDFKKILDPGFESMAKDLLELKQMYVENENGQMRGPFIDESSKWTRLAIKKLLTLAYQGDYDGIIFRPGWIAAEFANVPKQHYEKTIPDTAKDILKNIGFENNFISRHSREAPSFFTEFFSSDAGVHADITGLQTSNVPKEYAAGRRDTIKMTPELKNFIKKGLSMFSVGGLAITNQEGSDESN